MRTTHNSQPLCFPLWAPQPGGAAWSTELAPLPAQPWWQGADRELTPSLAQFLHSLANIAELAWRWDSNLFLEKTISKWKGCGSEEEAREELWLRGMSVSHSVSLGYPGVTHSLLLGEFSGKVSTENSSLEVWFAKSDFSMMFVVLCAFNLSWGDLK